MILWQVAIMPTQVVWFAALNLAIIILSIGLCFIILICIYFLILKLLKPSDSWKIWVLKRFMDLVNIALKRQKQPSCRMTRISGRARMVASRK